MVSFEKISAASQANLQPRIIAGVDLISDALPFGRLALLVSWYRRNVCICLQRHTAGDNRAFDAI